jgi:hypothetical protein
MSKFACLLAVAAVTAAPAIAKPAMPSAPPATVQRLLDCRKIADGAARLACFDAESGTISAAIERKDLVVADREQIRTARRSLFGLTLPSFNLFGRDDDDTNKEDRAEFAELNSTITQARKRADRNWIFILEDGAKWVQIDARDIPRDPRAGMKIRIKRAAVGSFLANVDGQIAVRVHREN